MYGLYGMSGQNPYILGSVYGKKIFNPTLYETLNIQFQNILQEHIVVNYALHKDLLYF